MKLPKPHKPMMPKPARNIVEAVSGTVGTVIVPSATHTPVAVGITGGSGGEIEMDVGVISQLYGGAPTVRDSNPTISIEVIVAEFQVKGTGTLIGDPTERMATPLLCFKKKDGTKDVCKNESL